MDGSHFTFDGVNALYYDLNTVSLSRDKSYIDSSKWLKSKKAIINPKNDDDNCFQYALTVALNHEQIKTYPERILDIKSFIDQYNWNTIQYKSIQFESNNKSIVLNILYVPYNNTKEIRHAYKSKYNLKRQNQVILLMITDGKKWLYLAVKSLSA